MSREADKLPRFPIRVNASDHLKIDIHLHSFFLGDRQRQCWTYITKGLNIHGQQELVLSLLLEDDDSIDGFPKTPVKIFQLLEDYAIDGKIIRATDATRLGKTGLFGFTALFYLPPIQFEGLPDLTGHLAMMLVHHPEYNFARRYGFSRLVSRIGKYCSSFPYPTWNTRRRPCLIPESSQADLSAQAEDGYTENTILEEFTNQIPMTAQTLISGLQIHLSFPTVDQKKIVQQLSQLISEDKPILIRPELTQKADACLYWEPDQTGAGAYTAPDQVTRIGLSFVILRRAILSKAQQVEDGMTFYLSSKASQALKNACIEHRAIDSLEIDPLTLSLEWEDALPDLRHNGKEFPVPRAYVPQTGWTEIQLPRQRVELASVRTRDPDLLVNREQELAELMAAILGFLRSSMDEETGSFNLTITSRVRQNKTSFMINADVDLSPAFSRFITEGLLKLGPATFLDYPEFTATFEVNPPT